MNDDEDRIGTYITQNFDTVMDIMYAPTKEQLTGCDWILWG